MEGISWSLRMGMIFSGVRSVYGFGVEMVLNSDDVAQEVGGSD